MIFLSISQRLALLLVVWQAQAQVTSRGFKFTTRVRGRGGCSAEDVDVILTELEIANAVIAFCEPFFKTKGLGNNVTDIVSTELRLQQFKEELDKVKKKQRVGFNSVNMSNVGNMRSQVVLHELAHTAYASKPEALNPTAWVKKLIADYAYLAPECIALARGSWDERTPRRPTALEGAKRAAMNAESWGLIGMGIYVSRELGVSEIFIPWVPNIAKAPKFDT